MDATEFQDRLFEGRLTRREAKRALAAAGVMSAALPMTRGNAAECAGADLTFFTWGGYDDPNFMGQYIEAYGCEPSYGLMASEDEAFAKMRAGYNPHVVYPSSAYVKTWKDAELIIPVDTSLLSHWDDLIPATKEVPNTVIDGERYFVPEDWGQTSILIRADLAPEYADPENHTWGVLYDDKYAGRVATQSLWTDNVYPAAAYLGLDAYNLSDADIEEIRALLRRQVANTRVIVDTPTDASQALFSGEVVASVAVNSMWMRAMEQMEDPAFEGEYVWMNPREGTINWIYGLVIHHAARDDGLWEQAHVMIDSMISPEAQYYELTEWNYGVVNAKVYEMVDDELLQRMGLQRDIVGYLENGVFLGHNDREQDLIAVWEETMAGM